MRRVIQITITVFEKKTADILIVLARLPYNKPAYLSINLDTVRAQYTSPRIHNPPFLSPAWLLSRRKRRGNKPSQTVANSPLSLAIGHSTLSPRTSYFLLLLLLFLSRLIEEPEIYPKRNDDTTREQNDFNRDFWGKFF